MSKMQALDGIARQAVVNIINSAYDNRQWVPFFRMSAYLAFRDKNFRDGLAYWVDSSIDDTQDPSYRIDHSRQAH